MKPIIKAENLSKQYRLGTIGTGTLRQDVSRWMHKVRGKEDPYLKIGETNDRSTKGESDYVWALKDINFEVMPGEVLGIIGKNGAGKSTLLKILSKVTGPTTGRIDYNGRIGSLLEVGTGFHPELTGRENIFLNGAILGMTKHEIRSKLDEIIDFSGCERYIDTPVKRYSSGMTVRLGFAVAAHLEPEILVVDEVLAVGDAEFQKKAIGKMQDVSRNDGRTVLFVSHNMGAVKNLCQTALILKNGTFYDSGKASRIVDTYLEDNSVTQSEYIIPDNRNNGFAYVERVVILDKNMTPTLNISSLEHFSIKIQLNVIKKLPHFIVGIGIATIDDVPLQTSWAKPIEIDKGKYEFTFIQDAVFFRPGKYKVAIGLTSRESLIQYIDDIVIIELREMSNKDVIIDSNISYVLNQLNVRINKI
jgi:lipopolysaccharide transport system ATP-binding protein